MSKSKKVPVAITKDLWEQFEDLCDDEGLSFEEGIETLIEQAVDNWEIIQWCDDDEQTIVNDWKDLKENGQE